MPKLDTLSGATDRLRAAQEGGRIPEDLHADLTAILDTTQSRIAAVRAASDISDELVQLMSVRSARNLRSCHINTLDELCGLTLEELDSALERAEVKDRERAIQFIREELNRHGIPHKLG
ncbi:MAG: hypothetical protein ABIG34_01970 [Candidatus Peregrinibacteria bacterium]